MVQVTLPYGYGQNGGWRHSVWLRPWTGHDESLAAEEPCDSPAARATALLARCAYRERRGRPVSAAFARRLSAGDRDALLLHLRRITLGGKMACVWTCGRCGEAMELELEIEKLICPPGGQSGTMHERVFEHEGAQYKVRFRVPNGGDLEAAAAVAPRDAAEAESLVLERCLGEVRAGGDGSARLPQALIPRLCEAMQELDPQAEVMLDGVCSGCGERFDVCCDAAQLVFREMERGRAARDREVHLLAYYYHWTENEILAMTGRRRQRYVRGLIEGLERRRG